MTNQRARVFLVEDEELTRLGVRHVLEPEYEIVGEADNVPDAVEMIGERKPDLVLLDVRIREGNGAEVVAAVKATDPDIKFLALTVSTSRDDVIRLFRAGVDGYISKLSAGIDLVDLVRQVLAGGQPISRQVAAYLLDIDAATPAGTDIERLTMREREVVLLIARGYTYRETAHDLGISIKTLESHISRIFKKLHVATRHELTRMAYETGFIDAGGRHEPS